MSGMIGEPFEHHGITVGPSLPAAQLAQGSFGLYVATLQSWLRLLAEVTSIGAFFPDPVSSDGIARFGAATRSAVLAVQAHAGLPQTGAVNAEVWTYIQEQLIRPTHAPFRGVLPPTPLERIPEFPERGSADYDAKLRAGLEVFGFRISAEGDAELLEAVSLFKRLARDQPKRAAASFTDPHLANTELWREQWQEYRKTWGRFFGAPWLGIIIDETVERWGTHELLASLYRIGATYLRSASTLQELQELLSAPIHVRAIATRMGGQADKVIDYPGLELSMTCETQAELAVAVRWLRAVDAVSPGIIVVGDPSLASAYRAESPVRPGRLPIRTPHSGKVARIHIYVKRFKEEDGYLPLEWSRDFSKPNLAEVVLHRTNVFVGAYLPASWRAELPEQLVAVVNGAVEADRATSLLMLRGVTPSSLKVRDENGAEQSVVLEEKFSGRLTLLGVRLLFVESHSLQPGKTYRATFLYRVGSQSQETLVREWQFQTLPAALPSRGFSFVAASCYSDFGIVRSDGVLAELLPAGAAYLRSLSLWLSRSGFFAPSFKALLGDNVYLDVAPDTFNPEYATLIDANAETLGRYLRYWAVSSYGLVLSTLPTFGIPDDHEYWNDYPRKQIQSARSSVYHQEFAAAAQESLRMFQGAMVPYSQRTAETQGSVKDFTYDWRIDDPAGCPLDFFFFDTTSTRFYGPERDTPVRLADSELIERLEAWAHALQGPGILMLGQPLMVPRSYLGPAGVTGDYHPSAFRGDYRRIMSALAASAWDILIVTGDVHWSRFVDFDVNLYADQLSMGDEVTRAASRSRYRPSLVEVISSPAQRLSRNEEIFSGSYSQAGYDDPRQIYATESWVSNEGIHARTHGPRVLASTYASPFAAIRCQAMHQQGIRVDVAFVNKDGAIANRAREASTTAPADGVRWLLPNEWVKATKVPNELWRDYVAGAGRGPADSVRPFYPYGSYDDEQFGVLPPVTTSGQYVRGLALGERLFVKRVLYQAKQVLRGGAPELAYQCVEVATMNPLDQSNDYGSRSETSWFVWAIYNGQRFLEPCDEHLYSVTLRKRLPWFEAGDRFTVLTSGAHLWDKDQIENQQPKERYELGEIARAPFTGHSLRLVEAGETGTVTRVYFQAEQVFLQSQNVLSRSYQLLEVEMDGGGSSGRKVGVYWSVYDGVEWSKRIARDGAVERTALLEQWKVDEIGDWLRRSSGQAPNQYWAAARLSTLLANPASLQLPGIELSRESIFAHLWIRYRKKSFAGFVANLFEYHRYIVHVKNINGGGINEQTLDKELRIGDRRIYPPLELRAQSLDAMCIGSLQLAIGAQPISQLAETLRATLGGTLTWADGMTASSLPSYVEGQREVFLTGRFLIDGREYPALLLRSNLSLEADGQRVRFSFWPDHEGNVLIAQLDASAFFPMVKGVITWQPPVMTGPMASGDTMRAGEILAPGGSISSANGRYKLTLQGDGNLVLYKKNTLGALLPLWDSHTAGRSVAVCNMQSDGNLVLFDPDGHVVWASDSHGHPEGRLIVQNDGNVAIYTSSNELVWNTLTQGMIVHWKSVIGLDAQVGFFVVNQFNAMDDLFASGRINTTMGTVEDLSGDPVLAALASFNVGTCMRGGDLTNDQIVLFANRSNANPNDLVIYIVRTLIHAVNSYEVSNHVGCAAHPIGQPGAVVVPSSANWLTAHEVGHVLGLDHDENNADSLMWVNTSWTHPPPDLSSSELATMRDSELTPIK